MTEFKRVRDTQTGHEFDLPAGAIEAYGDAVEVLDDYPSNDGPMATARPAKYSTDKASAAVAHQPDGPTSEPATAPDQPQQSTTQVSKPAARRAVSGATSEENAR